MLSSSLLTCMNNYAFAFLARFRSIAATAVLPLICATAGAAVADTDKAAVNRFGAPARDAEGAAINYTHAEVARATAAAPETNSPPMPATVEPNAFVPAGSAPAHPFWQYAIFGSGIGASNIIPAAAPGAPSDVIVGGNSTNNFGGNDYWQVLRVTRQLATPIRFLSARSTPPPSSVSR